MPQTGKHSKIYCSRLCLCPGIQVSSPPSQVGQLIRVQRPLFSSILLHFEIQLWLESFCQCVFAWYHVCTTLFFCVPLFFYCFCHHVDKERLIKSSLVPLRTNWEEVRSGLCSCAIACVWRHTDEACEDRIFRTRSRSSNRPAFVRGSALNAVTSEHKNMPQWPLGSKTKLGWRCGLSFFLFSSQGLLAMCCSCLLCYVVFCMCLIPTSESTASRQMASRMNVVDVRRLICIFVYFTPTWVNARLRKLNISGYILKICVPQRGKELFSGGKLFFMWEVQDLPSVSSDVCWDFLRNFAWPFRSLDSGSCVARARMSGSCCFKVIVMVF